MYRSMLLGCVALLLLGGLNYGVGQPPVGAPPVKWEHRAVPFSADPDEASKLLNELNAAGWEYVGPIANNLVAFRRIVLSPAEIAARKEAESLQGTWLTIATEMDGERRTPRKEKFIFNGNSWRAMLDDEVTQEGIFKIVSIGPRIVQIDMLVTDGYKQGDTWLAIYQIDGDRMKFNGAYLSETRIRAKTMSTREDDGYYLRTMRHEKEK